VESVHLDQKTHAIDVQLKPWFKLTEESFTALHNAQVPEAVLSRLQSVKDIEFRSREALAEEIAKVLDYNEAERFRTVILNQARLADGPEGGSFIPERLIQAGFRLKAFKEKEINIEDVFMRITKGITS